MREAIASGGETASAELLRDIVRREAVETARM